MGNGYDYAEFDVRLRAQPEPRWRSDTQQLAEFDVLDFTFNRCLEEIQLRSSVQDLMSDRTLNQSLEGIQLPNSGQSLMFGYAFIQCMEGIQLPGSLRL